MPNKFILNEFKSQQLEFVRVGPVHGVKFSLYLALSRDKSRDPNVIILAS